MKPSLPSPASIAAVLLTVAAAAYMPADAVAQILKSLQFIPENVDFGNIREADGKVSRSVKAVNISSEPTFIISARTSCGCSEAVFDGRMLAPGDTTEITVAYDPTGRPGRFQKTAKIFTGKERVSNSFRLSGNVIPSAATLDRSYPAKAGQLRLSTALVNVGDMKRDITKPLFVGIYNGSDAPVALRVESDSDALECTLRPDTIEPYGTATVTMMLKGRLIPASTKDFTFKATLTDAATGRTLIAIPAGGTMADAE